MLAIYFVATALLFADSMFVSLRERHYSRMGEQDVIIFDCGEAPLEELATTGLLAEYGIAEILGYVLPDGQRQDNGFSIARFDATALALARKEPLEGRLPERAGEIALERSALARLRSSAGVGDTITLTLLIPDGSGFMAAPLQKRYTLVGILTDKLIYLDRWKTAHPAYRDYPAGVLSMEEQIEPGGRAVINCYGRYAGEAGATFERLQAFFAQGEAPDVFAWWEKLEHTGFRPFDNFCDATAHCCHLAFLPSSPWCWFAPPVSALSTPSRPTWRRASGRSASSAPLGRCRGRSAPSSAGRRSCCPSFPSPRPWPWPG